MYAIYKNGRLYRIIKNLTIALNMAWIIEQDGAAASVINEYDREVYKTKE